MLEGRRVSVEPRRFEWPIIHNFVRITLKHVTLRKGPGRNLEKGFKTANKVFWQTIRRLRGKRSRAALFIEDSNGVTLKDQDAILNRWRESDLLNPVDATYKFTKNRLGKIFR